MTTTIHPLVAEVVQASITIPMDSCNQFINAFGMYLRQDLNEVPYREKLIRKTLALWASRLIIRLGLSSPEIADFFNYTAQILRQLCEKSDAVEYGKRNVEMLEAVYADHRASLMNAYNNYAAALMENDNYEESNRFFLKALTELDRITGNGEKHNSEYAAILSNIASTYSSIGKIEMAELYYQKALNAMNWPASVGSVGTAIILRNIGKLYVNLSAVHRTLNKVPLARDEAAQALTLSQNVYGEKHIKTAACYNALGLCFKKIGDMDTAIEMYQKKLAILQSLSDGEDRRTSETYYQLGQAYAAKGEYQISVDCLNKAIHYWQEHQASEVTILQQALRTQISNLVHLGLKQEAEQYQQYLDSLE